MFYSWGKKQSSSLLRLSPPVRCADNHPACGGTSKRGADCGPALCKFSTTCPSQNHALKNILESGQNALLSTKMAINELLLLISIDKYGLAHPFYSTDRHNADIRLYYHFYKIVTRAINNVHSCIPCCSAAAGGTSQ